VTSLDLPSKYLRIIGLRFDAILCSNLGNENSDVGHVKHSRRLQVTSPVYKSIRAYFKLWSFLLLSQTKKIHTHASKTLSFFIRHELSRTLVRATGEAPGCEKRAVNYVSRCQRSRALTPSL